MSNQLRQLKSSATSQAQNGQTDVFGQSILHTFESREGAAFGVVQVATNPRSAKPVIALLEESLENFAASIPEDANVQHRFEQFLSKLNKKIARKVASGLWAIPIGSIHAVIGVASPKEMYLTGTGEMTTLFLHKKPDADQYQIFNLNRSIQTEQAKPDWEKLFGIVLDGDLHAGDVLCLANLELERLIDAQDLNTTLAKLPPKSAVEKIRQSINAPEQLSMLVIKSKEPNTQEAEDQAQPLSHQSIEQLGATKQNTKDTLSDKKPSPIKTLKKIPQFFKKRKGIIGIVLGLLAVVVTTAFKMIVGLSQKLGRFVFVMFKKEERKEVVQSSKRTIEEKTDRVKNKYKRMPTISKRLLLAAVGLLVVFGVSIAVLNRSQETQEVQTAYNNQINEISSVIDRAEGAVIYQDENQARDLYQQARSAIEELSDPQTDEQRNRISDLQSRIAEGVKDVHKITTIESPEVIADLAANDAVGAGRSMASFEASLYIFDDHSGVFRVNREEKSLSDIEAQIGEIGTPQHTSPSDNVVYLLEDRPGLSIFNPIEKTLQVTESQPEDGPDWQDLAVYANNVYILETDNESGQIRKFPSTGGGLGAATAWFPVPQVELQNATNLTIDGTIFVITADGTIARFLQGQQTDWSPTTIEPSLNNPSDIYTNIDSDHVYITDPSENRLIVLNKSNGALITQYQSEAFSGLRDVVVDEDNAQAFLLTTDNVFRIGLDFLQ